MKDTYELISDKEIIQKVLAGKKEMYGVLVERYQNFVKGYAFYLCQNVEQAADLTQESFITAYQCLGRLKNTAVFPGWIIGILKNKYRNQQRKNKVSIISLSEFEYEFPDSGNIPAFSDKQLEKVSNYVYSLPEIYREVVLLRYLQDSSYKEIARILDIPVTTVTKRLFFARKFLLKKALKDGLL